MDFGSLTSFQKFINDRSHPQQDKYIGQYRALVVETNDPLNLHRVRVRIPMFHDSTMKEKDCVWASPLPSFGGQGAGQWFSPVINDWVFVEFEGGNPYNVIYTGFADPSRRHRYTLFSVSTNTVDPVKTDGEIHTLGSKFGDKGSKEEEYFPWDGRPMSCGIQDLYGNADIISSVGFSPISHRETEVTPVGEDPITKSNYNLKKGDLESGPDCKHMTRITKYGMIFHLGDQGYKWLKSGESGEFYGASNRFDESEEGTKDLEFEAKRARYIIRLINEDKPKSDQRKVKILTRYGHLFEMRDTGWGQKGPKPSKTRQDEYGDPATISDEETDDHRWIKLRTKGGMLFQMMDMGFDPEKDEFIKRKLIDEVGVKTEKEDEHWKDKDARQMRWVTRHGFKFVMFDAKSDDKDAFGKETPRGTGVLLKGRRSPGKDKEGDERGFFWEFNETEDQNATTWGTPEGQYVQLSDKDERIVICSRFKSASMPWKHIKENEFIDKPLETTKAQHLVFDLKNEFVALRTRGGKGNTDTEALEPKNKSDSDFAQGVEFRDGENGDGCWSEFAGPEERGIWLSKKSKLGVWRGKKGTTMYMLMDDGDNNIVIRNAEKGRIQLSCENIDIIADNLNIFGRKNINIYANKELTIGAGASKMIFNGDSITTTAVPFNAHVVNAFVPKVFPGPGAGDPSSTNIPSVSEPKLKSKDKLSPDDRGKRE